MDSPLDLLTLATQRHIQRNSKFLIDNIFAQDPLIGLLKEDKMLVFERWVRETRAKAGIQDPAGDDSG